MPSGHTWDVSYNSLAKSNSSPDSIVYTGAPGNFSYSVSSPPNSSSTVDCATTYTPSPSSGYANAGSTKNIAFSSLTTCKNTFEESNLPSGYTWSVTYNNIKNSTITPKNIMVTTSHNSASVNTYTATASVSGLDCTTPSESVEQGTTYDFSSWTCTTTFTESGLPSGTQWYVDFNGDNQSSASTTNVFTGGPGTSLSYTVYNVHVSNVNGLDCSEVFAPSPPSGSIDAGQSVSITYSYTEKCITTFNETGLLSGYTWNVNYDGASGSASTGSSISITTGAGTFTASASVSGLDCTVPSASVEAGTSYTFSAWTCTTTFDESNLPSGFPWNATYDSIAEYSTSTSMQFSTGPGSFSYSIPALSASSVEWNFGTSSYQGQIHQGMPTQAFPSAVSDLNNNGLACSSPYNSQGYTAVGYMYFTSSITVTITSDDATAVFYAPAGSSSWSSVFGSNAWHGQGATQYGPTTISVTPGWYEVAVDWTNICGPGMSAFEINGAYMTSPQFSVIAWTPSSNSVQLLPYSDVTANPSDPSGITVEQTGSWSHEFPGYFTYTYTPLSGSGTAPAGSTNSISYSTSTSSTTEFYETGLPSGYTWSVSYDGASGSASTGSPVSISLSGQSSQSSYTATASVSGLACTSSASVEQGTTYTFTSWSCTTTFNEANLPSGTSWSVDYDGNTGTSTSSSLQVTFTTNSVSTQSFTVNNAGVYYPYPSGGSVEEGTTYSTTIQFTDTYCNTIDFTTTSDNQHFTYYCVGGVESQIFWDAGSPGYISFSLVGANGQTYASGGTTNWPSGGIQGTYALPLQAYYVSGGTGRGGGSGTAQLQFTWPIVFGGSTSTSSPLSVSTSSTSGYICGGAAGNGGYTDSGCTNTISEGYNSGTGGSSVGGAGSDSFSVSGTPDLAAMILGFNDGPESSSFKVFDTGAAGTGGTVSLSYTVSSNYSPVLVMVASGWYGWNSVSLPSGFGSMTTYSAQYVDVGAAADLGEAAGTYTISVTGSTDSYISIEVLVFPPIPPP